MSDEELREIRDRIQGTTPPPWHPDLDFNERDFRFIAHAREDVPELLAEIDRLRAENARLANRLQIKQSHVGL